MNLVIKNRIDKLLQDSIKQLKDPKEIEVAKTAVAQAERVAKELFQAEEEELRKVLKKAAGKKHLNRSDLFLYGISGDCPGATCGLGCGTGCLGGCLIGGVALVGIGAAAGTAGGAGTAIALGFTTETPDLP